MDLSVQNCRGQCNDGANNMVGSRFGVATQIQKKEPRAILTHCYGHSLQLAVDDMVREERNLQDALDTTSEISKLLKYLPKRDRMFEKLKAELAPQTPGFHVLCTTRWIVRVTSLQSMIDNWIPLQDLWDESLETNLESEVKSRVIGVKHQVGTFDYYFRVSLGAQILRIGDNLSKTLQDSHISDSEGQEVSNLTVKTLEKMRSDNHFNLFLETVTHKANALEVSEPLLPRR